MRPLLEKMLEIWPRVPEEDAAPPLEAPAPAVLSLGDQADPAPAGEEAENAGPPDSEAPPAVHDEYHLDIDWVLEATEINDDDDKENFDDKAVVEALTMPEHTEASKTLTPEPIVQPVRNSALEVGAKINRLKELQ